ncbi:hypothetical protein DL96DRAFT_1595350 [Flagelloscypha sp. PMI_526]|nr:hypothetical protein DL96DRAFT_1595350 [Flagelloscypha sp. PMI_526]
MTARELPPELWIQIYSVLATLSDSYRELATYLLICKLSYSSLYPRLFETLHLTFNRKSTLRQWIQTRRESLSYAVKRAHIPWESNPVGSDLIVSVFETCQQLERVACWVSEEFFQDLAIARALASLPNLRFLQINVTQLSFILAKRHELSASFHQLDKLCLHFWDNDGPEQAVRALKSIDWTTFKRLTRLSLTTEGNAQIVVDTLLSSELPPSLNIIVIFEDKNDWTTIPSPIDDPRIVYYKQILFEASAIRPALASIRERPKYDLGEYPFDDWAEITSSKGQSLWLWAEEAMEAGKKVFSRPV